MMKLLTFVSIRLPRSGGLLRCTKCSNPTITICRSTMMKGGPKRILPQKEANLRKGDKIPKDYDLIYVSQATRYIRWCYPMSVISLGMISASCIYYNFIKEDLVWPARARDDENHVSYRNSMEVNFTYGAYLIMNILTVFMLKRAVMRIWYNPLDKNYKMILIGTLPPFKRCVNVKPGEVKRKHIYPQNAIQEVIHWRNRTMYYISMVGFRTPADYYDMVGHDPWNEGDE